jgi:type VI secretion system protein ImpG
MDPRLHQAFLEELEALEKFRVAYSGMYPDVPLASEDPDVRRLLEALALFTARTHLASERNVEGALLRIVHQHFPYLLTPVPAMFMLRASVTRSYVDMSVLPRGAQVSLVQKPAADGGTGSDRVKDKTFVFRTLSSVKLLPIALDGVDTLIRPKGQLRLLLRFSAKHERGDDFSELPLHIDYLGDLHSSLLVLHALERHLVASSLVWHHKVDAATSGEPCRVAFGPLPVALDEIGPLDHPVHAVRRALHFPQLCLYLTASGFKAPRSWRDFSLVLDLDDEFPANLRLHAECFQLHVVPAMNLRRETADPITHDGTTERHRVRSSEPAGGFVPVSIHSVSRKTPDGLVPLEPAVIRNVPDSYEAALEGRDTARRAFVSVRMPNAFDQPEALVVDALWHQPAVSNVLAQDCQAQLLDRHVQGVRWDCLGRLRPHADSQLDTDRQAMLQLLSIRGQRVLSLSELTFLLHALGVSEERAFAKLIMRIDDVRVVKRPAANRGSGWKHVYELTFAGLLATDMPRTELLCSQLIELLSAWAADHVIELIAKVPNLKKELRYSPRPLAQAALG